MIEDAAAFLKVKQPSLLCKVIIRFLQSNIALSANVPAVFCFLIEHGWGRSSKLFRGVGCCFFSLSKKNNGKYLQIMKSFNSFVLTILLNNFVGAEINVLYE